MESPQLDQMDYDTLAALLAWHVELGADEAIGDLPLDRYELPDAPPVVAAVAPRAGPPKKDDVPAPVRPAAVDAAARAQDLPALQAALAAFEGCELKKGARNTVFADGVPGARIMVIGEAPGREEDIVGKPFVGRAGQIFDRMFEAIDLRREADLYLTTVMPWRPPENRELSNEEIAMMLPFVQRHVALAQPEVLVVMGNIGCQAILGRRGIPRLRGTWSEALGLPVLPMFPPAYLVRNPVAKREAWHDLLMLRARVQKGPQ